MEVIKGGNGLTWKMAACVGKPLNIAVNKNLYNNLLGLVRYGHWLRGKPPGVAKSLEQKLSEINYKDPAIYYRVDIGFPRQSVSRSEELSKRLQHLRNVRKSTNLEKQAREKQLLINLDEAKADWLETAGPYQIKKIADHYGIYKHLFGDAYFVPRKPLQILYENNEISSPVFYGNVIKPSVASKQPSVAFKSDENSLWTLVMTNPDGHLTEKDSEYVHWFVGNIPGSNISKGETIVDYLQPFPPKGTGYHRHIFILYKQNKKMDYSSFKKCSSFNLSERTFSTLNFYRERQDNITPISLAFFQSDWDKSLTEVYHHTLDMKEPVFEYDFPSSYIRPQKWFPLRQPFNLYMDKYKDPKEVATLYLKDKLKDVHPFQPPKPQLPFPNAEPIPHSVPSWLKLEIRKKRLGWGRVNDV